MTLFQNFKQKYYTVLNHPEYNIRKLKNYIKSQKLKILLFVKLEYTLKYNKIYKNNFQKKYTFKKKQKNLFKYNKKIQISQSQFEFFK